MTAFTSTKMRKDEKEDSLPFRVLHNLIFPSQEGDTVAGEMCLNVAETFSAIHGISTRLI